MAKAGAAHHREPISGHRAMGHWPPTGHLLAIRGGATGHPLATPLGEGHPYPSLTTYWPLATGHPPPGATLWP